MTIHTSLLFLADRTQQALTALRDNGRRTALSILGIAVGIAAVMAVGTIGKSGNHLIFSELETFGLTSLWVFRDWNDKDPHRLVRDGTGIDNDDYRALQACCPSVRQLSAEVRGRRQVIQTVNRYSNALVLGVDYNFTTINNDSIEQGRPIRLRDITSRRAVAIIGPTAATDLFGQMPPIGREFRLGARKFTVIGVLSGKSRDFLSSIGSATEDPNNRILIPYTTYQQMLGHKLINVLQAEAISIDLADAAASELIAVLERRNGRNYRYRANTMAIFAGTADRIMGGVSMIGIIAASMSLLVGGMGIMNIMSTSVLERTREIGLRKAIGARRRDIMLQFLMEAALISTFGGVIGLALGGVASVLLAYLTGFPLTPSATVVGVALLVSIGVGVISGYLPARRAASLHPVQALRYE